MIDIYTGPPGSGKSLHMAKVILMYLSFGRRIITNFEFFPPEKYLKKGKTPLVWDNSDITVDNLKQFARDNHRWTDKGTIAGEHQTLVVLDECQLLFNKNHIGTKQDYGKWTEFFTQHRKYGFDILLVTQHIRIIVEDVRELLETETMHFKWDNCPSSSLMYYLIWIICKIFRVTLFFYRTDWVHFRSKEFRTRKFFTYRKKFASVYDSYKLFESSATMDEKPKSAERTSVSEDERSFEVLNAYAQEILNGNIADRFESTAFGVKVKTSQADETQ